MTAKGRGMMGLVVLQELEGHQFDIPDLAAGVSNWWPSSCLMPQPLGVTLVTVNLAMPHGTCSLATAGGPPV
ncbi:unnamed protein product [Staurois parvus]|uniref:Uncharacterized protein n=1 Tax=Staurois parvus TaxID=386267 RepID=A0ABN9GMG5_9NEOB|nr:unnamed protein product [Staurois parvus]